MFSTPRACLSELRLKYEIYIPVPGALREGDTIVADEGRGYWRLINMSLGNACESNQYK